MNNYELPQYFLLVLRRQDAVESNNDNNNGINVGYRQYVPMHCEFLNY